MSKRAPQEWVEDVLRAKQQAAQSGAAGVAGALDTPVLSPCIGVCAMDAASGFCLGCLRTIDEIAAWSRASEATRRAINAALPPRRAQIKGSA